MLGRPVTNETHFPTPPVGTVFTSTDSPAQQETVFKIHHLPPEILDEIFQELPKAVCVKLLTTSSTFHAVLSRIIYNTVNVQALRARQFLAIIASPESRRIAYGSLVRSLGYTASSNVDVYMTFILLCKALTKMDGLVSLSLTIPKAFSKFLLREMHRTNIFRQPPTSFDHIHRLTQPKLQSSYNLLPYLQQLVIFGDVKIVELARYRPVRELQVIFPMDFTDLTHFFDMFSRDPEERVKVRSVAVSFNFQKSDEVIFALWGLSHAFQGARHVSISASHINSLVSLELLFNYHHSYNLIARVWFYSTFIDPSPTIKIPDNSIDNRPSTHLLYALRYRFRDPKKAFN